MTDNISAIDYREVMEYSLDPLIIHSDHKIIYINKAAEQLFMTVKEAVIGGSPLDIFKETSKSSIRKRIAGAYSHPADVIEETVYRMDGTAVDVELYCHPLIMGETKAIQTYIKDITDRKKREALQKEMETEINELSATIVPVVEEIGVLPLGGKIDQEKAAQLLDLVPVKVHEQNITYLIIDFSGVYTLDNVVIDSLFRISSVLAMLGVKSIITGLRAELAVEATSQGIDLSPFTTMATVKEALSYLGLNVKA
ncbi:PAS domain S-box-containing protein [Gracilibacillus ureilyticus]|uniref:PAS domain S-box-containing protein n=1 Tax=Gracilibacillus ureilyticus TaxID=531814 RepID=A0A1H9UHE2_9BACI|nr:PAS domain S-box protein [Gracilibacillus ureilyticus]SES08577.1 PAS domain S-box-containing protein [Gracilibacillus ureilyticus]